MNTLCIIPARGGSKGVLNKNKKLIAGKPLIQYTFESVVNVKQVSEVVVSSDDVEILEMARVFNFTEHKRSMELATDKSPVIDTVLEIIRISSHEPDAVLILQPTSPLRTNTNINEAIEMLETNPAINSVISVVPMDDIHPARMYKLSENILVPFLPEFEQVRRQDIPVAYYRNGAIYLTRTTALKANKSVMNKPIKPYVMETDWLLNIDTQRDVFIAEALIPEWEAFQKRTKL